VTSNQANFQGFCVAFNEAPRFHLGSEGKLVQNHPGNRIDRLPEVECLPPAADSLGEHQHFPVLARPPGKLVHVALRANGPVEAPPHDHVKIKEWRGLATRHDKTPESYAAGLHLRGTILWLRSLPTTP
jgi:hypothetical protein